MQLLLVTIVLIQLVTNGGSYAHVALVEREMEEEDTRALQTTTTIGASNNNTPATSSSSSSGVGAGSLAWRSAVTTAPSSSSDSSPGVETTKVSENSQRGGQRYDLVLGVGGVSVVIIAALLYVIRRNKRAGQHGGRDIYKSSADEELCESVSSMSSTWKVGSTNTRTQPRPSSPNSSYSTAGASSNTDSETMSGIWRDPIIASARIPFEEIRLRTLLCRGGFGEVFEGVFRDQKVAVKRLLPETRKSIESLEYFMLEVRIMATLNHPRVVQFIGVGWDAMRDLCIVSEFMAHGDLRKVLTKWRQREKPLGFDKKKLKIAMHVAEALTYLHSLSPKKIIHRDLKSRNILVDEKWDAKLSDFGISRERSSQLTRTLTANIGSSLWMAPEIMLGENYDEKADIYSFGIVLTELDTHLLPYHNVTTPDGRHLPEPAILNMVTMGSVQAEFSALSNIEMVALGRSCLSLDPSVRPPALEIVHTIQKILATL